MPNELLRLRPLLLFGFGVVLICGIFLRLPSTAFEGGDAPLHALAAAHPTPGFQGVGFDENLYGKYVNSVIRVGIGDYPAIVDRYIEVQKNLTGSILPPVRFLYIFTAYLWHQLFGSEALAALRAVASLFSILTLLLSTLFAWRLKGPAFALEMAVLVAISPTQLHMSQHALVDGFFTFWALLSLWLLWENLQAPGRWPLLSAYVITLALLVTTKENSAFVWTALVALLLANRWLRFGTITRELLVATVLGPLLGVVILIFMAGGISTLIETYQLSVSKNYQLAYAIMTGDGPWHRYLVDLLLVSPVVLLLALGALFRLNRTQKPELFLAVFIGASYLIMCSLKYGMNLRYANMWDMPLRLLALSTLAAWCSYFPRYRVPLLVGSVMALGAYEFHQYVVLCVQYPLYELVTEGLLRALQILKTP